MKRIVIKSVVQQCLLIPLLAVLGAGCGPRVEPSQNSEETQNSERTSIATATPPETPATLTQTETETLNGTELIADGTQDGVREESDLRANLEKVYFQFDSYGVTARAKEKLLLMARSMKNNPNLSIQIEGYTDERGSEEYNWNLGKMRAGAVKEFLVAQGVNPQNLSIKSYGEKKPAITGSTAKAWTQNRRVEFKILKEG